MQKQHTQVVNSIKIQSGMSSDMTKYIERKNASARLTWTRAMGNFGVAATKIRKYLCGNFGGLEKKIKSGPALPVEGRRKFHAVAGSNREKNQGRAGWRLVSGLILSWPNCT